MGTSWGAYELNHECTTMFQMSVGSLTEQTLVIQ